MATTHSGDPNDPFASRITEATDTIRLNDGRKLAFCDFGDPTGPPVFVFHGGVGSRGFGLLFAEAAADIGVRIISPDRPGYGRSDPQPDRTLLDWPADVSALGEASGLDEYGVLGVSGGGPWAAACAYALPDRLTSVALASPMGPSAAPQSLGIRLIVRLARHLPWLASVPIKRQLERAQTNPEAAIAARANGKAEPEAQMHRSEAGRQLNAQTAEAGRQGHRHAVDEIAIVGRPWGFDLADIAVPVRVWHGSLDLTIAVESSKYYAEVIPEAQLTVHEDVGHISLPVNYSEEILAWLIS